MSYSGGSGPLWVGRASSSEPTAHPRSGHGCSSTARATSAPNYSSAPTILESTWFWTAGPLGLPTKYSELASAASIEGLTVGWKSSQRKRCPWAPSRPSHRDYDHLPRGWSFPFPLIHPSAWLKALRPVPHIRLLG